LNNHRTEHFTHHLQGAENPLLVLTSTFPRWGGDSLPGFVYELSRRIAPCIETYVLAPFAQGAPCREKRRGMRILRFKYWFGERDYFTASAILPTLRKKPWLWLLVPFFVLSQFLATIRIIRRHSIQTIHAHWILPQGLLAVLCKLVLNRNIRVVITSHGADVYGLRQLDGLKKWILNRADAVTVVSWAIRDRITQIGVRESLPIHTIPMGVDLSLFHPNRRDDSLKGKLSISGPFLLYVGRLSEKKGLAYLLQALPAVIRSHPQAKLVVVGDGEERSNMTRLAGELGLTNENLVFVGSLPNTLLPQFYATADLFIGPSVSATGGDQEGFGLVFVEAMGCGCPAIVTDLPAISDIVMDGVTGLVVPQKNSVGLALAILLLLADPKLRDTLGRAGRIYVSERFDWELIAEKYMHILKS
jgi:glycosyltransferase involved in cell wall biosynthesis